MLENPIVLRLSERGDMMKNTKSKFFFNYFIDSLKKHRTMEVGRPFKPNIQPSLRVPQEKARIQKISVQSDLKPQFGISPIREESLLSTNVKKYLESKNLLQKNFISLNTVNFQGTSLNSPRKASEIKDILNSSQGSKYPIFQNESELKTSKFQVITPSPRFKKVRLEHHSNNKIENSEISVNRTSIKQFKIERYDSRINKRNNQESEKKSKSIIQRKNTFNKPFRHSARIPHKKGDLKSVNKLRKKYFNSKKHKKIKNLENDKPRKNSSSIGPKSHIEYLERSNSRLRITKNHPSRPFQNERKYPKKSITINEKKNLAYPKKPRDSQFKNEPVTLHNMEDRYKRLMENARRMFKSNPLKIKPKGDISPVHSPSDFSKTVGVRKSNRYENFGRNQFSAQAPKNHSPELLFDKHTARKRKDNFVN